MQDVVKLCPILLLCTAVPSLTLFSCLQVTDRKHSSVR